MNGIFAQRRARLLSMKAVREAGPQASACPGCGAQSDRTVLSRNLWVCPKCGHHFPLDAYSRLKSVLDAGSFRELNEKYPAADPLRFPGYPEKLKKACLALGGIELPMGELSFQVPLFDFLPVMVQFWSSDDEFPAVFKLMWDENVLQFLRFETVCYAARFLVNRLQAHMGLAIEDTEGHM